MSGVVAAIGSPRGGKFSAGASGRWWLGRTEAAGGAAIGGIGGGCAMGGGGGVDGASAVAASGEAGSAPYGESPTGGVGAATRGASL